MGDMSSPGPADSSSYAVAFTGLERQGPLLQAGFTQLSLCPLSTPGTPLRPWGLTSPTRLMAQVKQWLAMAAFLASIGHMDSLREKSERNQVARFPA